MSVLALIPARSGSKGIPYKNKSTLGALSLAGHAVKCAHGAGLHAVLTTDDGVMANSLLSMGRIGVIARPAELAQDDTPMIAVVQHALAQLPGQPDDIIVLLQPTQPLRKPEHVQQAITLLRESGADSVVSVMPLPLTHSPDLTCLIEGGRLWSWWCAPHWRVARQATRRQDATPAYIRDGTVYAFWRKTVDTHGSIYGEDVRPLIIDPADTCELDSESDWAALERRWKERHD